MEPKRVVGIDLDNTIVIYDDLLAALAVERGLIPAAVGGKRQIRDAVRQLPGGEIEWQRLQAAAYGPRIGEACLAEGVAEFLACCRRSGIEVYAVSHKTERASYDQTGTNLRQAALDWMEGRGLFAPDGGGLGRERVFFGATRQEKIDTIGSLGCTHFIDDLEETFREESFPAGVERILYAPHPPWTAPNGVRIAKSWAEILEYFFGR